MPQLPLDRSSSAEPPSSPTKRHPIHALRKLLLIAGGLGLPFFILSVGGLLSILVFGSIIFAMSDLLIYFQDPSDRPRWPLKRFVIGDLVFTMLHQVLFWADAVTWIYSWYYLSIFGALASVVAGSYSIIHAFSFYKQLVAWYKQKWQTSQDSQPKEPCLRCGYVEEVESAPCCTCAPHARIPAAKRNYPANLATFVGPSAEAVEESLLTPASQSAMEEGLLGGYGESEGYGTIEDDEIVQAGETLGVKGKKKKRVVSRG